MNLSPQHFDFLKSEYGIVLDKINHFDNLRLRTKQLAITLWVAVAGVAVAGKSDHEVLLLVIGGFVPIPFWYVDAVYHANQEGYIWRYRAIEAFLNNRIKGCLFDGIVAGCHGKAQDADDGNPEPNSPPETNDSSPNPINDESPCFPIPDAFGGYTNWKVKKRKRETSVCYNAFGKGKTLMFYLPLCVLPFCLSFFL